MLGLPHQARQLPSSPGSQGRPAGARHPRQIPVSRSLSRLGVPPKVVPVSDGECISTPRPGRRARPLLPLIDIFSLSTERLRLSPLESAYPPRYAQHVHRVCHLKSAFFRVCAVFTVCYRRCALELPFSGTIDEAPSIYGMEGASLGLPHRPSQLPGSPGSEDRTAGARHPRQSPVSRSLPRLGVSP